MSEKYEQNKKAEEDGMIRGNNRGSDYFTPCNTPPFMGVEINDGKGEWDFAFRESSDSAYWDYRYGVTYHINEDTFTYHTDAVSNLNGSILSSNEGIPWDDETKAAVEMGIRDYYMNSVPLW